MKLGLILVLFVCFRHNTSLWLNDLTGFPTRGIFYIQGGLWEAFLCLVLYLHLSKDAKPLGGLACTIGAVEGLQMAVCRLFGNPRGNICDALSGFPIGATAVSIYAIYLCEYVGRNKMNNRTLMLVPMISAAEVSYLTTPYAGIGLLALCYAVWRRHGQPT